MPIARTSRRTLRIELIPMIDVVFFLLVFFMVFSTFKATPDGFQIHLPKAASGSAPPPSQLVISIDQDGSVFVGEGDKAPHQVNLAQLKETVADAVHDNPDLVVMIQGDRSTQYDHVIAALDTVAAAGAHRWVFAVEPKS